MRRPFVISTGALALALLPAALYAQTPPAAPAQQPPPAQPATPAAPAKPALAFSGNAGLLLVQVKPDQTATFEEMMKKLGAAFYVETAQKLGLNVEKFKADMASAEIAKQVKDDAALAGSLGIHGTPGFFVNGVAVKGAYPPAHFATIIDRWLAGGAKK